MIAEETAAYTYSITESGTPLKIRMTIQIQTPGEDDGDVAISVQYEPVLTVRLRDAAHRSIYEGVHGGIAAAGLPLPPGGLIVRVLALELTPRVDAHTPKDQVERVSQILRTLAKETVASLWAGLRQWSSPPQPAATA